MATARPLARPKVRRGWGAANHSATRALTVAQRGPKGAPRGPIWRWIGLRPRGPRLRTPLGGPLAPSRRGPARAAS
eukprot:6716225-Pyramimonas_sp.AAC.1